MDSLECSLLDEHGSTDWLLLAELFVDCDSGFTSLTDVVLIPFLAKLACGPQAVAMSY
jgi:hypothetical protein